MLDDHLRPDMPKRLPHFVLEDRLADPTLASSVQVNPQCYLSTILVQGHHHTANEIENFVPGDADSPPTFVNNSCAASLIAPPSPRPTSTYVRE